MNAITNAVGPRNCLLTHLDPRDPHSGEWNVVIETPKGSRNKFTYDERQGLFRLKKVLPLGAVFPYDFGFIPSTLGGDADPLDVLVLMDAPAFPGCLVPVRLLGVIEAEQTEAGEALRNDRLIAVAADSHNHRDLSALKHLHKSVVEEIEHFFTSYHALGKKPFQALGRGGPKRAEKLARKAMDRFRKAHPDAGNAVGSGNGLVLTDGTAAVVPMPAAAKPRKRGGQ